MTAQLNPAYTRDAARWYPLKDHPIQLDLINDDVRFKVVPAGRRSGKTERAKRFVAKKAMARASLPMPYFLAAPTRDQAKRIYWEDMKRLCFTSVLGRDSISESELTIRLPNGNRIILVGLDQPSRVEGTFWAGGVVDEIADIKATAWAENIKPSLDTINPEMPGYRPWCWLIGVPEGLNHYYDLAEYARVSGDPDWKLYHWTSEEILPPDVIASAKRSMSKRQYNQEYRASFETATGRIYDEYGPDNATSSELKSTDRIMWMHDFNFVPMSSAVGVRIGDSLFIVDEMVLQHATARQSALEFIERYKAHKNKVVDLYGDPAGKAGEKHGHASDYTDMEKVLRDAGWEVNRKVKAAAPSIKDRQNAVRAKVRTANGAVSLYVNQQRCPYMHKGLATVTTKEGSTFQEEVSEFQHITTAIGYCVDYEWPIRAEKKKVDSTPIATVHHYNSQPRR